MTKQNQAMKNLNKIQNNQNTKIATEVTIDSNDSYIDLNINNKSIVD